MTKKLAILLPRNAYIQIDKIHVTGPCRHSPRGKLFFTYDPELGIVVPSGASAQKKRQKHGREDPYIHSRAVGADGLAYKLEIQCCPPKVLQKHNVFGHSSVVDYIYEVFDRVTRAQGIEVDPHDREEWKEGRVWLTEIHLTGNFGCLAQYVLPIIQAIDDNNVEGKHRDGLYCITLGFTDKRRSVYHTVTIYYKKVQLQRDWKKPGPYQSKIIDYTIDAIRAEVKLHSQGLAVRKLQYAANWRDVDDAALFFDIFDTYKINYAIQPLLTEEQLKVLTKAELNVYLLWLAGRSVEDQCGRTTAWKYTKSIKAKIDIDVSGNRRPEALPKIHLKDIFRPENLLPIPQWAFGTPYYFPPNQPELRRRPCGSGISDAPLDPNAPPDEIIWVDGKPLLI